MSPSFSETVAPDSLDVELWYAPLPAPLTQFARHYWFVVRENDAVVRWEVWQSRDAGGESTGHIHKNLMRPDSGVGGGAAVNAFTWHGTDAENIVRVLHRAWTVYPYRTSYRAFPGPNSNTFVSWVLKRAGLSGDGTLLLRWQAVGSGWRF